MMECFSHTFKNEHGSFCPGLQQLLHEHQQLNQRKLSLFELAQHIANGEVEDVAEALHYLRGDVIIFSEELEHHSSREEDVLFTKLEEYIGKDHGPIAVMEYEHDLAKEKIATFLAETAVIHSAEAEKLASYVIDTYQLLTEHFFKEENVLFPMAEQLLSASEKEELEKRLV